MITQVLSCTLFIVFISFATVLDPRFKETAFSSHKNYMSAVSGITEILKERAKMRTNVTEDVEPKNPEKKLNQAAPGIQSIHKF